ncbi:hypothetical protein F385_4039 [Pantoea agglomerans 299R]|nr:hypothetical protein F385_4039 [Pantoea agglomerans 299R]
MLPEMLDFMSGMAQGKRGKSSADGVWSAFCCCRSSVQMT